MGYPGGPPQQNRLGPPPPHQQQLQPPPLHSRPNSVASQRFPNQQHQGPPYPPHGAPPTNNIYGGGPQQNRHYSPQYGNIQVIHIGFYISSEREVYSIK